jgi:hypothetical protein
VSLLDRLARALAPEEAERVRREYLRDRDSELSPARRRMLADQRAWAAAHALDGELSPYELALADIYRESWQPAPAPVDQLTGRAAEPLRRPAPRFELGRMDKSARSRRVDQAGPAR